MLEHTVVAGEQTYVLIHFILQCIISQNIFAELIIKLQKVKI